MRAAQATALLSGRNFVKPDDVKLLAPSVLGHRIIPRQKDNKVSHAEIIDQLIEQVAVPI